MVGAPNLPADPRTRRDRLLRRLCIIFIHHFDRDRDGDDDGVGDDDDCHVPQDEFAHFRFWRDVEAKKSRVPVVVAALLVLVDLLLKHSHSLSPTSSSPTEHHSLGC